MRISAIIPTYLEAEHIGEAVAAARTVADEVIVVDAASPDGTAALARAAGASVITDGKGRGRQLRVGAGAARGEVLLFLHADARLRGPSRASMLRALAAPEVCGGNFLLRFVPSDGWARFFSWANDVRRRRLGIYYGDSAVFVRRRVYEALGGFRDLPIMEDYEFTRRLERYGRTVYLRDACVEVSARRFASAPARTLSSWVLIQTLYSLGVSPKRLAALYRDAR